MSSTSAVSGTSSTTASTTSGLAPVTFSGLASGLDTSSIVSKLMAVNQEPITALQNQETASTNTLYGYNELNTLLNTLQTSVSAIDLTSEVNTTVASTSSGAPFTATSANASIGSFNITVSQLAQVQKDITPGFASQTDSSLGTGTVTINNQTITVDSSNNSLQGLQDSINAVSGTTGVTASIINDGSSTDPYRLLLTGQDASSTFTISSSLTDGSNAIPFSTNITTPTTTPGSINTNEYASKTVSEFGNGTITINNQTIDVDSSNNSLQGLTSAINTETGTTGVSASISTDSTTGEYSIVLTGQDSSTPFTVSSSLLDGGGNAISFIKGATTTTGNITEIQTPQQANLTIDGVSVVSNSNTVTNAIPGITLNLNAVSTNTGTSTAPIYATSQLSIASDTSTLEKNINTFVTNYNAIIKWINAGYTSASSATSLSANPATASNPTDAQLSQILIGDPTINSLKNNLQSMISGSADSSSSTDGINNLSSIGITTNLDGTLSVNSTTLESALSTNFKGVGDLLAGNGNVGSIGLMQQFNTYLLNETSPLTGMYAEQQQTNSTNQTNLSKQITAKQQSLNQEEKNMNAQFTQMEMLISSLNSQSSYITTLDNLVGITSSSSSSTSSSSSG